MERIWIFFTILIGFNVQAQLPGNGLIENHTLDSIGDNGVKEPTEIYSAIISTSASLIDSRNHKGFSDHIFFAKRIDDKLIYRHVLIPVENTSISSYPLTVSVDDIILCTGETGTLTATGCTGTITWTGGGTPSGSTLSVNVAGTYTATCTVGQDDSTSDTGVVAINPPVSINVNDLALCNGTSGTLTATGCPGTITWTGGGTPSGSTLTVNTTGTYIATCKITYRGKECSGSDQSVVILNSPVTVSVNDLILCYGQGGNLTATGCAGTVTWNTGASGSSIAIYFSGTYVATCKVISNGIECTASDKGIVTINSPIYVNVSDIVLCNETSGTLTATGCYGTITWTGGGTPSGSSLAVNMGGTYTATCKVTANGKECSASDNGKVFINPPVNVNVNDIILSPGNIGVLAATGCNGTITWAGGGTPSGSTLSVSVAGTYTASCKVTANGLECFANDQGLAIMDNPTNYVEFGVNNTRNPSAIFDAFSTNKGVLLPRIDFNNRPTANLVSGLLIYVIANGPQGNNCFYYYNGTTWVKLG